MAKNPESSSAENIWRDATGILEDMLNKDIFDRWIDVMTPLNTNDGIITLGVENDFYQSWLEDNYLSIVERSLEAATGRSMRVNLVVDESLAPKVVDEARAEPPRRVRARGGLIGELNEKFTFDRFVPGEGSEFAYKAAQMVAANPGKSYNPLFLCGGVGLGKTHLMEAIGHKLVGNVDGNVVCMQAENFLNTYIDALQNRKMSDFRRKYRKAGALLLDEVKFAAGKERLSEELFHMFDELKGRGVPIVMTANDAPGKIKGLEGSLASRFEGGPVVEIGVPSEENRRAIIREIATNTEGYELDPIVEDYIATHVFSDVRKLEGALTAVMAYDSLMGRPDIDKIRYLTRHQAEERRSFGYGDVIREFECRYGLKEGDLVSSRRPKSLTTPRHLAMRACYDILKGSYVDIGQEFGGRAHGTVIHGLEQAEKILESEAGARSIMEEVRAKFCSGKD
jgi:chromosomal replication initiator protein